MVNINDDTYASYKLLALELAKLDYTMREYSLDNEKIVEFTGPHNKTWLTRASRLSYPLSHGFIQSISSNKSLGYEFVKNLGVSTPWTLTLKPAESLSSDECKKIFKLHPRLVVKPENASLSNGVTLDISSVDGLNDAIEAARTFRPGARNVLLQQQVAGQEVRFVALEGRIVAALLRRTPQVIGDGINTVEQLIAEENKRRSEIDYSMAAYPSLTKELITEPVVLNSIPRVGERIELSRSTMISGGASIYNIIDEVHSSYVRTAQLLVESLGAAFIVIDLMIEDYSVAQTATNMYFNEFNGSPVLKLFYSCRDGKNYDIVPKLVEAIHKRIQIS